ncbi:cache domain-containing protein, partial [Paenibacillus sepulcri]|nr:cache domain-containing protein [Paenibacillus sepulcri]
MTNQVESPTRQPKAAKSLSAPDSGVTRVMILASVLIVFSTLLIGTFGYVTTEREAVKKLKSSDLPTLAQSISAKVDSRIDKALETSRLLAHDPALLEWLEGKEQDLKLGSMIFQKTGYLKQHLDYSTTFIVSSLTGHYWDEEGKLLETVSQEDPSDDWFFDALASGQEVAVTFDYTKVRGDTFAFVNTLAGPVDHPAGVVGVGMNLHELSADFSSYKEDDSTKLWLIDSKGMIYLSDQYSNNGKHISDVLADSAQRQVLSDYGQGIRTIDYKSGSGERMDLISYPLHSTDLQLLVEVKRSRTVAFLQTIRWNTILAAAISIISIVFFFYYVSRKLANPFKRAIAMNMELETKVEERTRELSQRNSEIIDSISYAKLLQESVLPDEDQLRKLLTGHFVIWRPRDVVGG